MNLIALFMKSPEDGTAKTRLRDVLSEEAVERLYAAFVQDFVEKLASFPCDKRVLAYAGTIPKLPREIGSAFFTLCAQEGRDLGERLENYFRWSFKEGATKSVVIGSDSPTLPLSYLQEAFDLLDRQEAVLGPSEDGGYYLIGMQRLVPELFRGIPWGTERVFEETLKRAGPFADRLGILQHWYDVDTPMDLQRLRNDLTQMIERREVGIPLRTHRVLSELVF